MTPFIFLLAITSVSLTALAQVALRKTMLSIMPIPENIDNIFIFILNILLNPWFIFGMSCYIISIGLWMTVLSKTEVSLAYPLSSMGFIITAAIGYFFLKEDVNMTRMFGLLLICAGIIFISKSS